MQFGTKIQENCKIPVLDCLFTRDNKIIRLGGKIYRKATHIDRFTIDRMSSCNPTSLKDTTIRTLTRPAQLVCDSPDSLQDKTDYLNNGFTKTTTARTLSDAPLTVTLIPTLRPTSTLALLRQGLYRTSEAPLKVSHLNTT